MTAQQSKLVGLIQSMMAEYSIIESCPELNLVNDGTGWKVVDSTDGMNITKQAHKESLEALVRKAKVNADYLKSELEGYLYANLDSFPTFRDSDFNKDKDEDTENGTDDLLEAGGVFL